MGATHRKRDEFRHVGFEALCLWKNTYYITLLGVMSVFFICTPSSQSEMMGKKTKNLKLKGITANANKY